VSNPVAYERFIVMKRILVEKLTNHQRPEVEFRRLHNIQPLIREGGTFEDPKPLTQGEPVRPLVYVILLNWHGWRDTIGCLRSLEALDYPNCRVVVIDNGSTDESVARIRDAFPDISLIETGKNLGFAGGNNVGIRYALERGAEYVWLLNTDTAVDPHALSAMVEAGETDPKIGAVGSVLYHMDEPDQVQAWGGGRVRLWWGVPRLITEPVSGGSVPFIIGASLLIKSEAMREVGLLDEDFFMYWEDIEFSFRLRKVGWKTTVATNSRIRHKESGSLSKKSLLKDVYFNASAVRFFAKNHPLPLVPISLGVGGRLLKRIIRADGRRVVATFQGALEGRKQC
jgi:GT2 family glycosyltransferase